MKPKMNLWKWFSNKVERKIEVLHFHSTFTLLLLFFFPKMKVLKENKMGIRMIPISNLEIELWKIEWKEVMKSKNNYKKKGGKNSKLIFFFLSNIFFFPLLNWNWKKFGVILKENWVLFVSRSAKTIKSFSWVEKIPWIVIPSVVCDGFGRLSKRYVFGWHSRSEEFFSLRPKYWFQSEKSVDCKVKWCFQNKGKTDLFKWGRLALS